MAAKPTSVDQIFKDIFEKTNYRDDSELQNFESVDNIILKNYKNGDKQVVKSLKNFETLIATMSNKSTKPQQDKMKSCMYKHECDITPHDWYVRGNCFVIIVKPFIEKQYYELIKNDVNFNEFVNSNQNNYGNVNKIAGDYVYWPNIPISYFGWRQFIYMNFNIDIGEYIPLVHNRRLGNVQLFEFHPINFINVELSMTCNGKKLFVNGRSQFTDKEDDLFIITMADGSQGLCKVNGKLVYSNKNLFDYIRDDINLTKCKTSDKYKHLVKINLKSLRMFKEPPVEEQKEKFVEGLKVFDVITASSENDDIQKHVVQCVDAVNEHMIEILSQHDIAHDSVLRKYLIESNFMNFDYLIVVIWRLITKNDDFSFCETDIRLYLELLCEKLFGTKQCAELATAVKRCEPYTKLLPKVFMRFCNHWFLFPQEDPLESLACYYAIHYLIYEKQSQTVVNQDDCWNYSYENVIKCGVADEIMCKGFFKKIQSANACMVFNGKHYVAVKKGDDLFELTEKMSAISLSSVKFNAWKYLYFTEEGVYNLFINDYHSSSPFILGNTLLGAITKKSENTYLPESAINFMLDNGKIEKDIYKIYHVAKVCRDVQFLKNNMAIILAFNCCELCKNKEKMLLNDLFREIWYFNENELIIMGVYVNEKKMIDLTVNLKCTDCKQNLSRKNCPCYQKMEVDKKAFKIALLVQLFCNNKAIVELTWSLLYNSETYNMVLADSVASKKNVDSEHIVEYSKYFYKNRNEIIEFLYNKINKVDFVHTLIIALSNFEEFIQDIKIHIDEKVDDKIEDLENEKDVFDSYEDNENLENFYTEYSNVLSFLKKWNIWWDKLIVARNNDDLTTWLVRFYMRVLMSKLDLQNYS
jgi:Baculovirus DNA helicase